MPGASEEEDKRGTPGASEEEDKRGTPGVSEEEDERGTPGASIAGRPARPRTRKSEGRTARPRRRTRAGRPAPEKEDERGTHGMSEEEDERGTPGGGECRRRSSTTRSTAGRSMRPLDRSGRRRRGRRPIGASPALPVPVPHLPPRVRGDGGGDVVSLRRTSTTRSAAGLTMRPADRSVRGRRGRRPNDASPTLPEPAPRPRP